MVKVVVLAVIGVVFIVLLKEKTSALAILLMLAICMLIMFWVLDYSVILLEGFKIFEAYFDSGGYYIKIILKMVGVTYLCEFGTQICKDVGQGAIALQVELFGKIMVLIIGLPILLAIIEQLVSFKG